MTCTHVLQNALEVVQPVNPINVVQPVNPINGATIVCTTSKRLPLVKSLLKELIPGMENHQLHHFPTSRTTSSPRLTSVLNQEEEGNKKEISIGKEKGRDRK